MKDLNDNPKPLMERLTTEKHPLTVFVTQVLINSHFDGWSIPFTISTSPRNGLYKLEGWWGFEMYQTEIKRPRQRSYHEYRIPNVEIMKKAIAYFESKAWKLSEKEKASAIARTELLEQQIAKEKTFKSEKLAQELKELKA